MLVNKRYTNNEFKDKIKEIKTLNIGEVEVCGKCDKRFINIYQGEVLTITVEFELYYDKLWFKKIEFNDMLWNVNDILDLVKVLDCEISGNYTYRTATIEDLDLSIKTYNCLARAFGVNAPLFKLKPYSEKSLLEKVKGLGKKSLEELKEKLERYGIELESEVRNE